MSEVLEAYEAQEGLNIVGTFAPKKVQGQRDVLFDRHVREQRRILKHNGQLAGGSVDEGRRAGQCHVAIEPLRRRGRRPANSLMSVDLPQPDEPRTATASPCSTDRSRPCRTSLER